MIGHTPMISVDMDEDEIRLVIKVCAEELAEVTIEGGLLDLRKLVDRLDALVETLEKN